MLLVGDPLKAVDERLGEAAQEKNLNQSFRETTEDQLTVTNERTG